MTTLEVPREAETTVMIGRCGRRDRPDPTDPGTAVLVPVALGVAAKAPLPIEAAAVLATRVQLLGFLTAGVPKVISISAAAPCSCAIELAIRSIDR